MRNQAVLVLCASLLAVATPVPVAWALRPDSDPDGPILEVVGGVRALAGEFPWVVRLSVGCAGSLAAPKYVVTAAHCVRGTGADSTIRVTAGASDLRSPFALSVRSTRVVQAPGFRHVTAGSDWAVLELEHELRLPPLPLTTTDEFDRGTFTVVGWGATREDGGQQRYLRAAAVSSVDDGRCAAVYDRLGIGFVPTDMLCAGNDTGAGPDSCQGDSGGPLVQRDHSGQWVQVGIVSWGNGCARYGYPGVYGQVSTFVRDLRAAAGLPPMESPTPAPTVEPTPAPPPPAPTPPVGQPTRTPAPTDPPVLS